MGDIFRDGMDWDTWLAEQPDRKLLEFTATETRRIGREFYDLKNEHNEQMAKGGCEVTVTSGNPQQVNVNNLPKGLIALASGVSSGITLILLLVVLVILWQMGLLG